jgi:hypothetical protein
MPVFSTRSLALDGVSWAQGGEVETAVAWVPPYKGSWASLLKASSIAVALCRFAEAEPNNRTLCPISALLPVSALLRSFALIAIEAVVVLPSPSSASSHNFKFDRQHATA